MRAEEFWTAFFDKVMKTKTETRKELVDLWDNSKDFTDKMTEIISGIIKEFDKMDYQTFIQQATEFRQLDYDAMSKVIKFISIADNSHPWTVMRAAELLNWINSSDCIYKSLIKEDKDRTILIDQSIIDAIEKLWQ